MNEANDYKVITDYIADLKAENAELRERVAELERGMNKISALPIGEDDKCPLCNEFLEWKRDGFGKLFLDTYSHADDCPKYGID